MSLYNLMFGQDLYKAEIDYSIQEDKDQATPTYESKRSFPFRGMASAKNQLNHYGELVPTQILGEKHLLNNFIKTGIRTEDEDFDE